MTNQTGSYHHGDLRAALLAEAAVMIAEGGAASVTMRAIGQRLGVSRAAPYRHFASKTALLVAVAATGFKRLGARLQATGAGTPRSSVDEVIDLRSLVPLDKECILDAVGRINKVMLLHEDTRTGGMAGEIAAIIAEEVFDDLDGPIVRVTAPDTPVPYAASLEDAFIPQVEDVVRAARELFAY